MATKLRCNAPIKRRGRSPHRELIALRINAGLSREALAFRANVSRDSIRIAEDGFVPGPRVQFAIAAVFEMLPLDLWPLDRQRGVR